MTLVIMAAGMGSRYGGLKQIDPVGRNGEFILDFSIYDAIQAGFTKVVFIIKEENYEIFRDTVGKRIEHAVDVRYVFQKVAEVPAGFVIPEGRVKPWGTAHAVLAAAKEVDDNFAVINADDFYGRDAFLKLGQFLKLAAPDGQPYPFCMAGFVLANTLTENGHVARGICESRGGRLLSVTERTKIQRNNGQTQYFDNDEWHDVPEDSTVSMNCWGFTPAMFGELRSALDEFFRSGADFAKAECYLPFVVSSLIESGKCTVQVLNTAAKWYGVTYHDDKATVVAKIGEMIDSGVYPEKLWADR